MTVQRFPLPFNPYQFRYLFIGLPVLSMLISVIFAPVFLPRAMLIVGVILGVYIAYNINQRNIEYRIAPALMLLCFAVASVFMAFNGTGTRINYNEFFKHCDGAELVYTYNNQSAIIARYYSPLPVYAPVGSNDIHQWLTEEAKRAFKIQQAPLNSLSGDICIFWQDTPYATEEQRTTIQRIKEDGEAVNFINAEDFIIDMIRLDG